MATLNQVQVGGVDYDIGDPNAESKTNKVTSLSSSSTDTQYPSAKAVYTALANTGGIIVQSSTPAGNAHQL